uniref:ABC transporter permease protein n=1 Tax=uncultured Flavobacteriia bacterium TaxID=212695 RepID=H6REL4_9BACT|nr:oligopeptide transport system permease protein OppC [uncultured bacterium]CCF99475.1 ABC transporter permease protein [uncultured Flavobacteriia bacterium]
MSNNNLLYRQAQSPMVMKIATWIIGTFLVIGLCSRFIANDMPLLANYEGSVSSPATLELLSDIGIVDSRIYDETKFRWKIMPPIPYSSDQLNSRVNVSVGPLDNQEVSSLRYRHWFGTDQLGRDVLAGLVHGTNIAVKVGLLSVFFSLLLGLYLGLLSGYFGDNGWKINIFALLIGTLIKALGLYYILYPLVVDPGLFYYLILALIVTVLQLALYKFIPGSTKPSISLPIDLITTKIIEVLNSIPTLFIILAFLAIFTKPSIWNVIIIISIIGWPKFARLVRAEILQIKNIAYIESAKSIGLSDFQIILKHALPNAITSVISITAFAISGAILLESTLSFLGLGIPLDQVSWGSMLADARVNFSSWWLALFPGLAIFFVLISFYIIGNQLNEKMNARH